MHTYVQVRVYFEQAVNPYSLGILNLLIVHAIYLPSIKSLITCTSNILVNIFGHRRYVYRPREMYAYTCITHTCMVWEKLQF